MAASGRAQFNFSIEPALKEAFLEKARFEGTSGTALLLLWIQAYLDGKAIIISQEPATKDEVEQLNRDLNQMMKENWQTINEVVNQRLEKVEAKLSALEQGKAGD
jgi:sensor histidine kinase YesM